MSEPAKDQCQGEGHLRPRKSRQGTVTTCGSEGSFLDEGHCRHYVVPNHTRHTGFERICLRDTTTDTTKLKEND